MKKDIKYAVGNPGFRGRTTVEIDEQDRALVVFTRGDHSESYESKLSHEKIIEIQETLEGYVSSTRGPREKTRVPDEDMVTISYGDGKKLEFPVNLAFSDIGLRRIQDNFSDLIKTVSKNKLKY